MSDGITDSYRGQRRRDEAERRYFRALLEHLKGNASSELSAIDLADDNFQRFKDFTARVIGCPIEELSEKAAALPDKKWSVLLSYLGAYHSSSGLERGYATYRSSRPT